MRGSHHKLRQQFLRVGSQWFKTFGSDSIIIIIIIIIIMGRDREVGIATRYGLVGPGIESWWGTIFSAPLQTGPGAHPISYTMGIGSFSGVKRPGRGVDHIHPI
jgi:hypothetical protein